MYEVMGAVRSRAFRVMWMLEELGQPYTFTEVYPGTPEAKQFNPSGKIPAMKDGNDVLTDSVAIMTYLADKHGGMTAPAGNIARARQDAVTQMLVDEFDALLWTHSKHNMILPENVRMPQITDALKKELLRSLSMLEDAFQGPFIMGDAMSVPDILAVHCLGWARMAEFPPISDRIKAYTKEMRGRPAFSAAGRHA